MEVGYRSGVSVYKIAVGYKKLTVSQVIASYTVFFFFPTSQYPSINF
jgi:hypothetical protein